MRTWTETKTHREGENMGPVDWTHPTAGDKPELWREVETNPSEFRYRASGFSSFQIVEMCMYDGWPYWEPRPAFSYIGPMGSVEWAHFDSYGVGDGSIFRHQPIAAEPPRVHVVSVEEDLF